jgi:hypothetical protein
MKKRLAGLLGLGLLLTVLTFGCTVSVGVPPYTPPPPAGYARVVTADTVNVRVCPSARCEVRTVVYRGQGVIVYEYNSGWARVVVSDSGIGGWMDARFLRLP